MDVILDQKKKKSVDGLFSKDYGPVLKVGEHGSR